MKTYITAYGSKGSKGRRYGLVTKVQLGKALAANKVTVDQVKEVTGCCVATAYRWKSDAAKGYNPDITYKSTPKQHLGAISRRPRATINRITTI